MDEGKWIREPGRDFGEWTGSRPYGAARDCPAGVTPPIANGHIPIPRIPIPDNKLKKETSITIRPACEKDIPIIEKIFKANKKYLGFTKRVIMGASISKTELHVAIINEKIAGFIRWHRRRDGWSTVYELCVNEPYRLLGVGKKLMEVIGTGPAKLKCHSQNPAIHFYNKLGFKTVSTEITKGGLKIDFLKRE